MKKGYNKLLKLGTLSWKSSGIKFRPSKKSTCTSRDVNQ